jgi:membrane protein
MSREISLLFFCKTALVKTIGSFDDNDGWAYASHIAMSSLLAIFPFMIFVTSLAAFLGYENLESIIVAMVFETWPEDAAKPIIHEIRSVLSDWHGGLFTIGGLLALVFASNGVDALRMSFNRAYGVIDGRSFVQQRLLSLLLVILGSLVLILIAFLLVLHPLLWPRPDAVHISMIRYLTAGSILLLCLCACHGWLPAGKRPLSTLWPGLLGTMVLLTLTTWLFSLHLHYLADYGSLFAGLAGAMTSLIYLYIVACALILGGVINASTAINTEEVRNRNHVS